MSPPTKDPVHVLGDGIVGRRRELEWLREWLDAARHGTGRLVLCAGEPGIGKTRTDELSPREVEVARLVAEGLTNRQIAERLVISERTPRTTSSTSSRSWGSPPAVRSRPGACAPANEYADE